MWSGPGNSRESAGVQETPQRGKPAEALGRNPIEGVVAQNQNHPDNEGTQEGTTTSTDSPTIDQPRAHSTFRMVTR